MKRYFLVKLSSMLIHITQLKITFETVGKIIYYVHFIFICKCFFFCSVKSAVKILMYDHSN